jgi:hypothetical protein
MIDGMAGDEGAGTSFYLMMTVIPLFERGFPVSSVRHVWLDSRYLGATLYSS